MKLRDFFSKLMTQDQNAAGLAAEAQIANQETDQGALSNNPSTSPVVPDDIPHGGNIAPDPEPQPYPRFVKTFTQNGINYKRLQNEDGSYQDVRA